MLLARGMLPIFGTLCEALDPSVMRELRTRVGKSGQQHGFAYISHTKLAGSTSCSTNARRTRSDRFSNALSEAIRNDRLRWGRDIGGGQPVVRRGRRVS